MVLACGGRACYLVPHSLLHSPTHPFTNVCRSPPPCSPPHPCSLAYLHHLAKAKEPLLASLLAIHNVHFMNKRMEQLRAQIMADEI